VPSLLRPRLGFASGKFAAATAARTSQPGVACVVPADQTREFLAPLSVRKIHGVGAVTARRMEESGLRTIADLQALSASALVARFGKFGHRLALYAHGNDDRSVTPQQPLKSISAETTLEHDTASAGELRAIAGRLSERVAGQLLRKGVAGCSIVLKLKTSDFRVLSRSRRLSHPTQKTEVIWENVAALIDKTADGRSFRLIGVGVADIEAAARADPTDLFSFGGGTQGE